MYIYMDSFRTCIKYSVNFVSLLTFITVTIRVLWWLSSAGNKLLVNFQKYACLPARSTTERPLCKLPSDCYNPTMPATCAIPSLDNSTKLLRVIRSGRLPLLFLGYPLDLHYAGKLCYNIVPSSFLFIFLKKFVSWNYFYGAFTTRDFDTLWGRICTRGQCSLVSIWPLIPFLGTIYTQFNSINFFVSTWWLSEKPMDSLPLKTW